MPENIMRPGPWGNPFVIGVHGNRDQVCDLFEEWLKDQPELLNERWRLKDRMLVCSPACRGKRCHGDTWKKVRDMTADELMDWMLLPGDRRPVTAAGPLA